MIYPGSELELFSDATRWKAYWSSRVIPFLAGRVLEVGAGIGASTLALNAASFSSWTCVEPDATLFASLTATDWFNSDGRYKGACGDISAAGEELYDQILYLDVLEHIEDDHGEVLRALERLAPGGRLIVLAPAHQWLYSPFDASIGHHRRYSRTTLEACMPPILACKHFEYLDTVGLLASLANRILLRQSLPGPGQIYTWDRFMVPVSRLLDPLLGFRTGKSVLGIWQHRGAEEQVS